MIRTLRLFALFFAFLLAAFGAHAAGEPLPPDQAFRVSARALDDKTVEVRFLAADEYYLYRHRFKFEADGATLGPAVLPPGKPKKDDAFGEVEIYRGELRVPLPITSGTPPFTLTVTSQGCADMGICYPPQSQTLQIAAAASASGQGGFLARALGTAAPGQSSAAAPTAAADEHDESGRIARLLDGGSTVAILASFFGFGLLLAFTPCVFPMIPILSGIIVGHGHAISKGRAFSLSGLYVLGMALTYAAAGVAAGLSASAEPADRAVAEAMRGA